MKKILLMIALGAITGATIAQEGNPKMGKSLKQASKGVEVAVDELKSYEGSYELMPKFNLKVFVEKGALVSQATGQPKEKLVAQGNHVFITTTFPATITFVKDKDGSVNELTLSQSGQEVRAPRIEE